MANYTEANAGMCEVLRNWIASEYTTESDRETYREALMERVTHPEQPASGFRVCRGWRDGETMTPKIIAAVDTYAEAERISDIHGGWIERIEDGSIVRP